MQKKTSSSGARAEYISRINKALDYIEENISEKLTLKGIAEAANFSQFHFHRIFKSITGEALYKFIQRLRLEKAAGRLLEDRDSPVSNIAYDYGFASPASFGRAFKDFFGKSPTEWREEKINDCGNFREMNSNISIGISNSGKKYQAEASYFSPVNNSIIWRVKMNNQNVEVEVKDLPEMSVAYVRHIGPYKGDEELFAGLFSKIFTWAGARGLIKFPETKCLSFYHDDPGLTAEEKLRVSVGLSVPDDTPVDGEIGKMKVPGGKFAVAKFEIGPDEYEQAWNAVMAGWLPESGYQCDDRLCYENYLNDPKQHPEGKHILEICVPVKPL